MEKDCGGPKWGGRRPTEVTLSLLCIDARVVSLTLETVLTFRSPPTNFLERPCSLSSTTLLAAVVSQLTQADWGRAGVGKMGQEYMPNWEVGFYAEQGFEQHAELHTMRQLTTLSNS